MLRRISKREAFRLFSTTNRIVTLCPCKMVPDGPWSVGIGMSGVEWLGRADIYAPRPHTIVKDGTLVEEVHAGPLWKGTREATAWALMYNNWRYYNASYETGYYAHYYIQAD